MLLASASVKAVDYSSGALVLSGSLISCRFADLNVRPAKEIMHDCIESSRHDIVVQLFILSLPEDTLSLETYQKKVAQALLAAHDVPTCAGVCQQQRHSALQYHLLRIIPLPKPDSSYTGLRCSAGVEAV